MPSSKWVVGVACLLASSVLVGMAPAARAQGVPAGPLPVAGPTSAGEIDVRLSRVYVRIGKLSWDHEHAAEGRLLGGTVRLGAAESAGVLAFDMASFIADTQDSRRTFNLPGTISDAIREKLTQQMFGPGVLDVARFPQAVFRIRSALPSRPPQSDGAGQYQLDGELSMRGAARPLRIGVLVEPANDLWRLRGEIKIKPGDFGIHPSVKMLSKVPDVLSIEGDLWMRR